MMYFIKTEEHGNWWATDHLEDVFEAIEESIDYSEIECLTETDWLTDIEDLINTLVFSIPDIKVAPTKTFIKKLIKHFKKEREQYLKELDYEKEVEANFKEEASREKWLQAKKVYLKHADKYEDLDE